MILAAVSFSDPLMLVGLLAAAIPVALHLLNRVRSPIVAFPTLRFLKITAQKTARRRQVQHFLLLLLRMAIFAIIAMAVAHPLIRGGSSSLAYTFIVLVLAGLGLLVLAGAWGSVALDKKKAALPPPPAGGYKTAPPASSARYWGLSTAAFLLALLLAGYGVFGLTSATYFSGDKGAFSARATATVIILDNSHSMLATEDAQTRLDMAKKEVRQLLAGALRPAEAAILSTNPGPTPPSESLTTDMTSLIGSLGALQPTGRARAMKERIHTAVDTLLQSGQASKMLIIVSDFARPAFADAEVFSALRESKEGGAGKEIQVVLMPMGGAAPPADVGIVGFSLADGSAAAVIGSELTFDVQVLNNGDAAEVQDLELLVDGQPANVGARANLRVQLGPAGTGAARASIKIPYRLTAAGPHLFTLRLKDANDAMAWDNQRSVVVNVAEAIKVLIVGPDPAARGPRARSAAFFFQAALAPFADSSVREPDGKPMPWPIQPTYRGASEVEDSAALTGYAAVFLCDLPQIPAKLADSLVKYLKAGDGSGRVIWVLGPSVNGPEYNQMLLPRGLLPGALGQPLVAPAGSAIDWVDLQSDIFANLFDNQEPFRSAVVTGRWSLPGGGGRALVKLADGSIILTQHHGAGGSGDIFTLLTSPGAAWSNLGATVLLVPMASRMALGDSGHSRTPISYETGDSMLIAIAGATARMRNLTLDVTLPNQEVVNARVVSGGDAPRWYFDRTFGAGIYRWRSNDGRFNGMFAVNPPAEEVDLLRADPGALAAEASQTEGAAAGHAAIVASTAEELLAQLQTRSAGTSLSPGLLGMVLILAIVEALTANRYRPAPRAMGEAAVAAA